MRRREKPTDTPAEIARYRAADWPTGCHQECAYWAAVIAWKDTHPDGALDLDPAAPNTPFHMELI